MRLIDMICESAQDAVDPKGLGGTPNNQEIDYFGFSVKMKPSKFLELAQHLGRPREETVNHIAKLIKQGEKIGNPFLIINVPEGYEKGDFSDYAEVTGHEGRHRMLALMKVFGDEEITVHIFPRYMRRRHMTPEMVERFNKGMFKEGVIELVLGPLWSKDDINHE